MHDHADETPRWLVPCLRLVPLLVLLAVTITLLLIPMHVARLGFSPTDDALRYVGRIFSGKELRDIVVMREGIDIDQNQGWHNILSLVRHATNWNADALLTFSCVSLCLLQLFVPLFFVKRSEAWVATLLAAMVVYPHVIYRLCLGRPLILATAMTMVVLFLWLRYASARDRAPAGLIAATTALMTIGIYVHGGWYLFWLPAAGFFLAQRWKQGFVMTGCWLAASFLAGLCQGHPLVFLQQQLLVPIYCFGQPVLQRMMVVEFQPFDGAWGYVALAGLLILARSVLALQTPGNAPVLPPVTRNPAFMMAVACWVLGFAVRRFWLDWGTPAFLVWVATEVDALLASRVNRESISRVIATGILCAATYLAAASDHENRWTSNLTKEALDANNPDLKGWMPDPGGIIYSDDTRVFYSTFYRNPTAPWRYVPGFEVTFMLPEDLAIFRRIQWNFGDSAAYKPWAAKMRPQDRLILRRPRAAVPDVPELEWYYAATDTWIGRPRPAPASP